MCLINPACSYGDTQRVTMVWYPLTAMVTSVRQDIRSIPVVTSHFSDVHSQVHVRHHGGVDHVFLITERYVPGYFGVTSSVITARSMWRMETRFLL